MQEILLITETFKPCTNLFANASPCTKTLSASIRATSGGYPYFIKSFFTAKRSFARTSAFCSQSTNLIEEYFQKHIKRLDMI